MVNWRQISAETPYPRYEHVRKVFVDRLYDLVGFVKEAGIGAVAITQAEVNYVNAIDPGDDGAGKLGVILRAWGPLEHHLGDPEEASAAGHVPSSGVRAAHVIRALSSSFTLLAR